MRDEPCLVCGGREAIFVHALRRDHYLRRLGLDGVRVAKVMCRVCGLVYSRPQLEPEELSRLYDTLRVSDTPSAEHLWWKQRQADEDFQAAAPYLPSAGRMLDIGCSEGSFLMHFHRLGWDACGIEPSAYAQFGRRVYGLDIRQASFEDVRLPAGSFDLVAALRVLEHVADPRGLITRAMALLKPDGWLYLEVPDVWRPRHHPAEFLGAQHLRIFTLSSLATFLGQLGLAVRAIDASGPGLRALAQHGADGGGQAASVVPLVRPLAEARALRRALSRYQRRYFLTITMKTRLRRGLDRLLGAERARSLVAWGKRSRLRRSSPVSA